MYLLSFYHHWDFFVNVQASQVYDLGCTSLYPTYWRWYYVQYTIIFENSKTIGSKTHLFSLISSSLASDWPCVIQSGAVTAQAQG